MLHILIALRRYRNKAGKWPESLDQIKLSGEVLTDPHGSGAFVYRLTDDGFTLYSKGPNGIDNGGSRASGDQPIWSSTKIEPKANKEDVNDTR